MSKDTGDCEAALSEDDEDTKTKFDKWLDKNEATEIVKEIVWEVMYETKEFTI